MPILDLQRRHAELGRIRLGHKAATSNGKTRPAKLAEFRFTSPSERYIRDLAELYGGKPQPWDNAGKAQWEVYTTAKTIPIIVVKGGLSQWMETWSGGGCTHRCDGYTNVLTDTPCDPQDPGHVNAKPTTRLSVMLRELDAIGVWRLESHGWNAAVELPTNAELAAHVGDLVKAHLTLHERTAIKDGKTSRFVVPGLDLEVAPSRLVELAAGGNGQQAPAELAQPERAAIAAPRQDFTDDIAACKTVEAARELWVSIRDAGQMRSDVDEAIKARVAELQQDTEPQQTYAQPDAGPVDAEVVEDGDTDKATVWQQLVTAAGNAGIGMDELQAEVEANTGHTVPDATVADLQAVLSLLTGGEAVEAS